MKLLPKARPVQINKLRLGGKDINTMDDLLKNFCVTEILALGGKFTQWLNRHGEANRFASRVSSILNPNNSKKKQATDLLHLFFPEFKGQSLEDIFLSLNGNTAEMQLRVNIVNYIDPNVKLAIELLRKCSDNYHEIVCVYNWLSMCSNDGENSSDFCFLYGKFLKSVHSESADRWFKKASQMGNKDATDFLNSRTEEKVFRIKDCEIIMVKVQFDKGDFYIAKDTFSSKIIDTLSNRKRYFSTSPGRSVSRSESDSCLNTLRMDSKDKWGYPTYEQWDAARKQNKITMNNSCKGEWLDELKAENGILHQVITHDGLFWYKNEFQYNFRPVINI